MTPDVPSLKNPLHDGAHQVPLVMYGYLFLNHDDIRSCSIDA